MTITIAIPTYNRKEQVGKLLSKLQVNALNIDFRCLVIDDGSSDGTLEHLRNLNLDRNIFTISSRENRGYARTFIEILRSIETEWVLVTADDDDIDLENLSFLDFQMSNPNTSVIVTNYKSKTGGFSRGNNGSGLLKPLDLNHTAHAPGIIYRPSKLQGGLNSLEESLNRGSTAGYFYPQVVVSAHAIASRSAVFSPVTLVMEIEELPSQLVDSAGRNYWDPGSRIEQYLSFSPIFEEIHSLDYIDSKTVSSVLFESNRKNFWAISEEILGSKYGKNEYRIQIVLFFVSRIFRDVLRFNKIKSHFKKSRMLVFIYRTLKR